MALWKQNLPLFFNGFDLMPSRYLKENGHEGLLGVGEMLQDEQVLGA